MPPPPASMSQQIFWLLILAMPIAVIVRTLTYEEIFREPREWCINMSQTCRTLMARKFFYVFTCEYCASHWITLPFLAMTQFKLLIDDWRGCLIAWLALVLVANAYLNVYARLRIDITSEKKNIEQKEKMIEKLDADLNGNSDERTERLSE